MKSINFDRAATFYDATRKLQEDVSEKITQALLAEIRAAGAGRVLEVGIGTGRMARPLMLAGVQMVGVDISTEMMAQLRAQLTPEHTPPELLLGDATALPFRAASFRAAMVVHVLHLVASVEDALREIKRVTAPGGVLLQQTRIAHAETQRVWDGHDELWNRMLAERGFTRRKRPEPADIDRLVMSLGGTITEVEVGRGEREWTVEDEFENLRTRRHSWMWEIPDALIEECSPEYEAWMREMARPSGKFVDRVTYLVQVCHWP